MKHAIKKQSLDKVLSTIAKLVLNYLVFLVFMSIFRFIFFIYFQELDDLSLYRLDIIKMLILGFRIDLTVIGYIQALPSILLVLFYYLKKDFLTKLDTFFIYYLFVMFGLISLLLVSDFGFYSFFKEHINILIFGLFDDDTSALLKTFWQNYNVLLILVSFFIYLFLLFKIISFILRCKIYLSYKFLPHYLFFILLFALNFLIIRGTFGMYPLGKMIPNVSKSAYINKMSQNGVRAFIDAYKIRKKHNKHKTNYIKDCGFENNIAKAFKIYKNSENIDTKNLLNNITFKTGQNNTNYNVVIVMVESFGMPILKYQSEKFDILGSLKKHFDEDILLTNIISEGDGTIASLESLLLNIPYRPNSFPLAQSPKANTSFTYAPAFLYNKNGYESTFIYGGDLTWRDLGAFIRRQGYKNTFGKIDIFSSFKPKMQEDYYFHPWGIYDEYLYNFIFGKLSKSKNKEFILALSTNNHPPYDVPEHFKNKKLFYSKDLLSHITGDLDLAKQRFLSYAYALDSVGKFLDQIKSSPLKDNTIVVITADNNTVEGIMKYDKNPLFTSKNIPIYFYLPPALKAKLHINTKVSGSQKDIFPTLYNLSLNGQKYISLGRDLFNKKVPHYGFNGSLIVTKDNKTIKLKNLKDNSSPLARFYRANIAITDYLLGQYE